MYKDTNISGMLKKIYFITSNIIHVLNCRTWPLVTLRAVARTEAHTGFTRRIDRKDKYYDWIIYI